MPSLLAITSHFFLQIAFILLTYRLLWPLFRRSGSGASGRDHGGWIRARPFGFGVDMAGLSAMAVPHEADDRRRNLHSPEPHGHLRRRPARARALHVSRGRLVEAGNSERTSEASGCHFGRRYRYSLGTRRRHRMADGQHRRLLHGQGRALARWPVRRLRGGHYGIPDVGVDRLRLRIAQHSVGDDVVVVRRC